MSFFKKAAPYVIAGPCSAETREQVMDTAAALANTGVDVFRAGVWKPRTRPGTFEGNGVAALEWLQEVKQEFSLPVAVEVAEAEHIELALAAGIDVLWIGARTTVNPFQVQHLADALKGFGATSVPVMIKNPVNPDTDLWLGAIERIEKAGITQVAAIHRGFYGYNAAAGYRNQPNWLIPIELKRRRPDLPLFCDPSHISGKREWVLQVAQKAMDLRFDGLMIETHCHPEAAWSDAAQQVSPEQLREILVRIVVREEFTTDMRLSVKLEYLRQLIDTIDSEIIDLIAKRMELSQQIGVVKRNSNLTVYQPDRWREIVATRSDRAGKHALSAEFIMELYETIHQESIRLQLQLLETERKEAKNN
jgi:chorismate mutase